MPLTILPNTERVEYKVSKSTFYGYVLPADSKAAVAAAVSTCKALYPDATHVCAGYVLAEEEGAKDDGEPAGSAGAPILRRLKAAQLVRVVALVVRYYGGVKLGFSGLVQAYGHTAQLAIEQAQQKGYLVPYIPIESVIVVSEFNRLGRLKNWLDRHRIVPVQVVYDEKAVFTLEIPRTLVPQFYAFTSEHSYQLIG
jgi:uncharacterized YigZ family protein